MEILSAHFQLCRAVGSAATLKNQILCAVAGEKSITQNALCEITKLKKPNLSALCKSLEKEGLIKREKHGKFMHITLTDAGEKKIKNECAKINSDEYMKIVKTIK